MWITPLTTIPICASMGLLLDKAIDMDTIEVAEDIFLTEEEHRGNVDYDNEVDNRD